jgi:hypothetical protein
MDVIPEIPVFSEAWPYRLLDWRADHRLPVEVRIQAGSDEFYRPRRNRETTDLSEVRPERCATLSPS